MMARATVATIVTTLVLAGCAPSGRAEDGVAMASASAVAEPGRTERDESPREQQRASGATRVTTSDASPAASPPEAAAPYEPDDAEVYPNAKRLAASVARTLTTYDPGTTADELATAVTSDVDRRRAVVESARPLFRSGSWSRGRVVYPELAGVSPEAVAVMVLVEQRLGTGADADEVLTRTLDVRLRLVDDTWTFDSLESVGGEPPDDATPPPGATAVLDDPRIVLPDSARWDIQRGDIDPTLLRLMSDIADRTTYEVLVLSSGHPFEVFDTDRQSDHTKGRAVDIHVLGDERVIDARAEESEVRDVVEWLYERPDVSAIGSPWALDGYGGRSFSDVVHADHLHVAVEPSRESE